MRFLSLLCQIMTVCRNVLLPFIRDADCAALGFYCFIHLFVCRSVRLFLSHTFHFNALTQKRLLQQVHKFQKNLLRANVWTLVAINLAAHMLFFSVNCSSLLSPSEGTKGQDHKGIFPFQLKCIKKAYYIFVN